MSNERGGCYTVIMKIILRLIAVLAVAAIGFAVFLGVYGGKDTVTYQEEVAIVLGGGVLCNNDDGRPNEVLRRRLDKTIEYHKQNPTAKIIVTGGDEKSDCGSEAIIMQKYLIEHNISEDIILVEDRATSTTENFRYAREIMQEQNLAYAVAITSRSHIFRAVQNAQRMGLSVQTLHATEPWYSLPFAYGYEVPRTLLFLASPPRAVEVE